MSCALMYIHANINRTQTSKENYLFLSSLLVSLLWGLCRVKYSGWALLFTPRALETHLETRGARGTISFAEGTSKEHLGRDLSLPPLLSPIIFLEWSRNILFSEYIYIFSKNSIRGRRTKEEEFNSWKTFNLLVTRCYSAAMFAKRTMIQASSSFFRSR